MTTDADTTGGVPPQPRVLLIDDMRSFRTIRADVVARTSAEGIEALSAAHGAGRGWSEVWLDHDLGDATGTSDMIGPVIDWLCRHALDGDPADVGLFVVHTSNSPGGDMMVRALERVGYRTRRVPARPYLLS